MWGCIYLHAISCLTVCWIGDSHYSYQLELTPLKWGEHHHEYRGGGMSFLWKQIFARLFKLKQINDSRVPPQKALYSLGGFQCQHGFLPVYAEDSTLLNQASPMKIKSKVGRREDQVESNFRKMEEETVQFCCHLVCLPVFQNAHLSKEGRENRYRASQVHQHHWLLSNQMDAAKMKVKMQTPLMNVLNP